MKTPKKCEWCGKTVDEHLGKTQRCPMPVAGCNISWFTPKGRADAMKTAREFVQEVATAADIAWDDPEEEACMERMLKTIEARDAEWQARLDAAVAAERERCERLAHSYVDGIAARCCASVAHGIGEAIATPTPEVSRGG